MRCTGKDDMAVTIYHNPRCSKSRHALQLLRDRGIEPEIVDYLKTPPTADEIDAVLSKLRLEPRAAMRGRRPPTVRPAWPTKASPAAR